MIVSGFYGRIRTFIVLAEKILCELYRASLLRANELAPPCRLMRTWRGKFIRLMRTWRGKFIRL